MLTTPVALIIFNRPSTTERVLAEIAKAQPQQLFVIADGPRPNSRNDESQCAAARAVVEKVDWPCAVLRNYSDVNLGCGQRPATGISWLFEHVDRAIILEDDCLPHPTFFAYCEELLEKYRDDSRIMMIAGSNMVRGASRYSYNLCYHHSNWGWATWRRAWRHFDIGIKKWPLLRDTRWLHDILGQHEFVRFWRSIFDGVYAAGGNSDVWDYQWTFAQWAQYGLAITPTVNLITNVGFGEGATHCTSVADTRAHRPTTAMRFPLVHPPAGVRNEDEDRFVFSLLTTEFSRPDIFSRLRRKLSSVLPAPLRRQSRNEVGW